MAEKKGEQNRYAKVELHLEIKESMKKQNETKCLYSVIMETRRKTKGKENCIGLHRDND